MESKIFSRNSRSGFSLPAVLISAVIGGIVIMGLMTGLQNFLKGEKGARNSLDFDLLKHSVFLALSRADTCADLFRQAGGVDKIQISPSFGPGALVSVPVLKMGSSTLVDIAQPKISAGLNATKLELEGLSGASLDVIGGVTYRTYVANLNLEARKVGESYGRGVFTHTFPLTLQVNPSDSNRIARCNGTGDEGLLTASPTPSPSASPDPEGEDWRMKAMVCPAGLLMLGAGPGGPICGTSGQDHLNRYQDLPPGAQPVSCQAVGGSGKNRSYSCSARKSSCTYSVGTGWQIKRGGKTVDCVKGVNIESPDPGSIKLAIDEPLPSDVKPEDYEISCLSNATGTGTICEEFDEKAKSSLPSSAKPGECYYVGSRWQQVIGRKEGGSTAPTAECSKGLLMQPL